MFWWADESAVPLLGFSPRLPLPLFFPLPPVPPLLSPDLPWQPPCREGGWAEREPPGARAPPSPLPPPPPPLATSCHLSLLPPSSSAAHSQASLPHCSPPPAILGCLELWVGSAVVVKCTSAAATGSSRALDSDQLPVCGLWSSQRLRNQPPSTERRRHAVGSAAAAMALPTCFVDSQRLKQAL